KKREASRKADHRDRHEPAEAGQIHRHGDADPVEPRHEEAKAETPAEKEGIPPAAHTVEKPEQASEGWNEERQEMKRWQGSRRQQAAQESSQCPPPSGEAGQPVSQPPKPGGR